MSKYSGVEDDQDFERNENHQSLSEEELGNINEEGYRQLLLNHLQEIEDKEKELDLLKGKIFLKKQEFVQKYGAREYMKLLSFVK